MKHTYGRVVQDRPDIPILHLVEGIDSLHALTEQLVEHKADTSASRQLIQGQVVGVTVDRRPELRAKVSDHRQHDARRALVAHGATKSHELRVELLLLLGDARFDVRESRPDVVHEDLQ